MTLGRNFSHRALTHIAAYIDGKLDASSTNRTTVSLDRDHKDKLLDLTIADLAHLLTLLREMRGQEVSFNLEPDCQGITFFTLETNSA